MTNAEEQAMKDEGEKVCFAQIDGHLDSNPKIVKAGSAHATAIFQFLLRRVAITNTSGTVPLAYIDPEYLARTLFMTCDEARHGTSRALAANLIAIDETSRTVFIVGWSPEWGRRPKTGAERTQSWRERNRRKSHTSDVTECDGESSHVTCGDESDVQDKKRKEEKRDKEKSVPAEALEAADKLRAAIVAQQPGHRLAKEWPNATRRKWGEAFDLLHRLDGRAWADIALVIHWLFYEQVGDAKFVVQSPDALREKWDRIELARRRPRQPEQQRLEIRKVRDITPRDEP